MRFANGAAAQLFDFNDSSRGLGALYPSSGAVTRASQAQQHIGSSSLPWSVLPAAAVAVFPSHVDGGFWAHLRFDSGSQEFSKFSATGRQDIQTGMPSSLSRVRSLGPTDQYITTEIPVPGSTSTSYWLVTGDGLTVTKLGLPYATLDVQYDRQGGLWIQMAGAAQILYLSPSGGMSSVLLSDATPGSDEYRFMIPLRIAIIPTTGSLDVMTVGGKLLGVRRNGQT